ncbi:hypothetical protein GC209_11300 [bacterium]|nr:hypothetical protein [bacterium]
MSPRISFHQIAGWLGPRDRGAVALCGGLGLVVGVAGQGWAAAPGLALLSGVAAAITLIDLRHHRIPDWLSLPLIPLGLIEAALTAPPWPRLAAMAVVWLVLTGLQRGFLWLRGTSGLGGGDVKLMTAAAAWLPFEALPFYILAASVTALIEALVRGANRTGAIAFGVHLAPWLVVFALCPGCHSI